jgi:hypothetical protein
VPARAAALVVSGAVAPREPEIDAQPLHRSQPASITSIATVTARPQGRCRTWTVTLDPGGLTVRATGLDDVPGFAEIA